MTRRLPWDQETRFLYLIAARRWRNSRTSLRERWRAAMNMWSAWSVVPGCLWGSMKVVGEARGICLIRGERSIISYSCPSASSIETRQRTPLVAMA